jgi:hypothetical protein
MGHDGAHVNILLTRLIEGHSKRSCARYEFVRGRPERGALACLGSLWKEGDLVFPGNASQPIRPWTVSGGSFKRLLRHAKLPEKPRFR